MTLRLFLLPATTVFTARVNQTAFTYPLGDIDFDTGSAIGTVRNGMTVLFGSGSALDDYGRSRIRDASGIGSSGTLHIGRSSQGTRDGEVNPLNNSYITIIDDYRVWAKIPYIFVDTSTNPDTATTYKDHDIAVGDYTNTDLPPVANAGVGTCATIDGSDIITVSWDASTRSFATADGASISTYAWDVEDGTITVGSSSTAAITATFPAGFRWVHLTVTDSNAITHTMHMPVFARDPDNDATISGFTIEDHRITQQGQTLTLRIYESIPEATYPDGTLVMIWEDEPTSASDRSHMKFIGWHHTDPAESTATRTGILTNTSFECLDVAGKLDTLPGFPQSVISDSTPTSWEEMSSPNMDKYLHYLLHWHSTALDLADWTWSGTGSNFPFVILGSDGQSLFDQVARRAKALVPDYVLTCNHLGQMAVTVDPMLQDSGDRTSTTQATFTEADWTRVNYVHRRPPRVHWLRGDAILASASVISALFCVAPGEAPGQGEVEQQSSEQLAKSQTDLNAVEGHRYARINAEEGPFTFTVRDDKDIEPANMTWVIFQITTGSAAQRGFTTANRFLVSEINVQYEFTKTGLVRTYQIIAERETEGTPAATYIQPDDEIPTPEIEPPPPINYDDKPGETLGDGFGTTYVLLGAAANKIARTRDLSVTSPVWADVTGSLTGNLYDFILDPWNVTTRAFAMTSTGVWIGTGMDGGGAPTWTNVLNSSDVATATGHTYEDFWYKVQASINIENYIACAVTTDDGAGGHNLYCAYSDDAGATWSYGLIKNAVFFIAGDHARLASGLDIVPHLIGGELYLYALVDWKNGLSDPNNIFRSTNSGATWTQGTTTLPSSSLGGSCVNSPYFGNEAGNIVWCSSAPNSSLYKSTDGGNTFTTITLPGVAAANNRTRVKRLGIEIYIQDSDQVAIWSADSRFFVSNDGGSSFIEKSKNGYTLGTHGYVSGAGGFPTKGSQYYIVTTKRYVFVSIDGGNNWINKTGNLQTIIASDETVTDYLKGVIVPVWAAE